MPATRAEPPASESEQTSSESDDTTDEGSIRQHKGLLKSQPPLAGNERPKRLTKSQPTRVSGSRRGASIIVDYSLLRQAEGGVFDVKRVLARFVQKYTVRVRL